MGHAGDDGNDGGGSVSILLMSRIFKQPMGGATRKALAVRLADFADDEGRGIWPSVDRLSAETELSVRTVQRLLSDFVEEGILVLVKKASGRPGEANRYDFDLARLFASPSTQENNPETKTTGDTVTPVEAGERGVTETQTGDTDDADGCHGDTRTVREPLVNHQERESASERDVREEDNPVAVERAFKRWYPSWPTYVDDSEPKARMAWQRLTAEERSKAAELTQAYVEAAKGSGRKYICSAQVYLAEKRWEKLAELPKPASVRPTLDRIAVPVLGPAFAAAYVAEVLQAPQPVHLPHDIQERVLGTYEVRQRMNPQRARDYLAERGISLDAEGRPVFPPTFERDEERRLRIAEGWPAANRLKDAASERRNHVTVPIRLERLKGSMEPVKTDSARMAEWRAWFERHFRPFPPLQDWGGYFPAGGPDRLEDFRAALAQTRDEGEHDAA